MPPVSTPTDDLALGLELADAADAITLGRFRAADLVVETKPDLTPVSEADRAVEQALRERLAAIRPEDSVVGEEYGGAEGPVPARGRRWIVDPIDGTKGYVRGMPVWATLLALEQDGEMVLGIVSAPALGQRWWAATGQGAFTRGREDEERRPLRVSGVRELGDAQMCFGGFEEFRQTGRLDALLALAERCWRTRGYGDFWQYMLVAEGTAEIALDPAVSIWDVAAPMVIVQEAGGRFTDFADTPTAAGGSGIATNGLVHEAARKIIAA
jgi:histidinol-phosphatase